MSEKFIYFLNAVHYCIWRGNCSQERFFEKILWTCIYAGSTILLPKEKRDHLLTRMSNNQKKNHSLYCNKRHGIHISMAHNDFGALYTCYPAFISFVLTGIILKKFGFINITVVILFALTPVVLCFIPAYKAVFSNDCYLIYFKQFEKKDKAWHRKWLWITWGFCIGGVLAFFGGILTMMAILVGGYGNIELPFLPH